MSNVNRIWRLIDIALRGLAQKGEAAASVWDGGVPHRPPFQSLASAVADLIQ